MSLEHLRVVVDHLLPAVPVGSQAAPLPAARPVLLASMANRHSGPVLILTPRSDTAEELVTLLGPFLPTTRQPVLWDTPHAIPFEQLPFEHAAAAHRVRLLADLIDGQQPIIVASGRNLMHPTIAPEDLRTMRRTFRKGQRINQDQLMHWAVTQGYQREPLVFEPGAIAQRGGVIDIFPPDADRPIRLDLFGDEIESIRTFDPQSQRSLQTQDAVDLLPPVDIAMFRSAAAAQALGAINDRSLRAEVLSEWRHMIDRIAAGSLPSGIDILSPFFAPSLTSLLTYLVPETMVILDDLTGLQRTVEDIEHHADELRAGFVVNQEMLPNLPDPFLRWERLTEELGTFPAISIVHEAEAGTDERGLF
ncbi:MAG TPA: hypothetical protein PK819_04610, partial [Thermomicrobiales bacterium]|nr:hypothetical protein [Thermomicrobiales bacterium]